MRTRSITIKCSYLIQFRPCVFENKWNRLFFLFYASSWTITKQARETCVCPHLSKTWENKLKNAILKMTAKQLNFLNFYVNISHFIPLNLEHTTCFVLRFLQMFSHHHSPYEQLQTIVVVFNFIANRENNVFVFIINDEFDVVRFSLKFFCMTDFNVNDSKVFLLLLMIIIY